MKSLLLFLLSIVITYTSWAQQRFENGYITDNSGKKLPYFIKVSDLGSVNAKNAKIEIKNAIDAPSKNLELSDVQEILIENTVKLKKFTVQLDDTNSNDLNNKQRPMVYHEQAIFLNTVLEGKATLYSFDMGNGLKFFHSVDNTLPAQLSFRRYVSEGLIAQSNIFRQELMRNVRCENDTPSKFLGLNYTLSDISPIFESYNECHGSPTIHYNNKSTKGNFTFSVIAGGYNTKIRLTQANIDDDSKNKITLGLGAEVGYLTSAKDWEFIFRVEVGQIDAAFSSRRSDSPVTLTDEYIYKATVLDMAVGGRFYINPEAKGQFFTDVSAGMNFPFGNITENVYETTPVGNTIFTTSDIEPKPNVFVSFGVGCLFNRKFALSFRYDTNRKPADTDHSPIILNYNRIGLNLYYRF